MQKRMVKGVSLLLSFALIFSMLVAPQSEAKKSKIKLNKKKLTLYVGKKYTLKVKGTKKKAKWSIKSGKKYIKLSKKKKKSVRVTAKKKGTAKVVAKIGKKKLTCKVTVKKKASKKATPTPKATPVVKVTPTPKPVVTPEVPANTVKFSRDAGYYESEFNLTLAAPKGSTIYYTTDGSIPTKESTPYTGAIRIKDRSGEENVLATAANIKKMCVPNAAYSYVPTAGEVAKGTVIRAVAYDAQDKATNVFTKTFFVGGDSLVERYPNAAVISIVTDPDNLLNHETGIHVLGKVYDEWAQTDDGKAIIAGQKWWDYEGNYTQHGREWERASSIELFDKENTCTIAQDGGIRVRGGASRMYGQKSFNIYFRKDYTPDNKNLKYELFPDANGYATDSPVNTYKSFMIRNGGNDTEYTKFQCSFIQSLLRDRAFITQQSRPAVMYLNGEYWGVYNLTEKYDDKDMEENFNIDGDNLVMIKEGEVDEGEDEDIALYEELLSYANEDLTNDEKYEEFCTKVDIESMLDYYATEVYIANYDWPQKNFQLWRTREVEEGNEYADTKWRWMLFDTEYSMGLYNNTAANTNSFDAVINGWPNHEGDALFASVIKNSTFRAAFLARVKEIGSNNFNYTKASARLQEFKNLYEPLIDEHYARYGYTASRNWSFNTQISRIDEFLRERYDSFIPILEDSIAAYDE